MANNIAVAVALEAMSDNSDEESDDNDTEMFLLAAVSLLGGEEKPRNRGYTDDVVPYYSLEEFRRMFRISPPTFQLMLNYLEGCPSLQPAGPGRREPISIYRQLLVTLWYVGGIDSITKIGDRFGMSESTVISCRDKIISAILELRDRFIKWPNAQEMQDESNEFAKRNGFPGIVGALDGTHIEIKAPTLHPQSYVNRKGYHSLQLQCVCRHNMAFSHVFVGYPGSCHDARVLKNSDLWEEGLHKCNMVFHILGDGAYPLRRWLLTPFRDNGNLTPQQKKYNHCHSSNRVVIERAFALLKSRFRRLKYIDTQKVVTAINIIMACSVLHNICIFEDDNIEYYLMHAVNDNVQPNVQVIQEQNAEGLLKRNMIVQSLP